MSGSCEHTFFSFLCRSFSPQWSSEDQRHPQPVQQPCREKICRCFTKKSVTGNPAHRSATMVTFSRWLMKLPTGTECQHAWWSEYSMLRAVLVLVSPAMVLATIITIGQVWKARNLRTEKLSGILTIEASQTKMAVGYINSNPLKSMLRHSQTLYLLGTNDATWRLCASPTIMLDTPTRQSSLGLIMLKSSISRYNDKNNTCFYLPCFGQPQLQHRSINALHRRSVKCHPCRWSSNICLIHPSSTRCDETDRCTMIVGAFSLRHTGKIDTRVRRSIQGLNTASDETQETLNLEMFWSLEMNPAMLLWSQASTVMALLKYWTTTKRKQPPLIACMVSMQALRFFQKIVWCLWNRIPSIHYQFIINW